MTMWLSDLAAYSLQLAVLVATAIVLMTTMRLTAPAATLRFWQVVFASSLAWPGFQLWMNLGARRNGFAGGVLWGVSSTSVAKIHARVETMNADLAVILVVLLITGSAVRLGWLGFGLARLRAIRAASQPAVSLSSISGPLQDELDVSADIRYSDAVSSPATIGVRRPTILLPHHMQRLEPAVQRAVLSHELIHVRRRDWLSALLEELWCAVLWFHPAARALACRLTLARETLVDQATIAYTRDRRAYAAALLEFSTAQPRMLGATGLIGRRQLEHRIALIAQEVSMSRSSLTLKLTVAAAVVTVATLATTTVIPLGATLSAQAEKVYRHGRDPGITLPRVIREVKPVYTQAALQARIQGTVWLSVIVLASGDVGDVAVVKSLDTEHGLDQQAVDATRQWTFEPGQREGKPVPVEVTIEMTFTLKK